MTTENAKRILDAAYKSATTRTAQDQALAAYHAAITPPAPAGFERLALADRPCIVCEQYEQRAADEAAYEAAYELAEREYTATVIGKSSWKARDLADRARASIAYQCDRCGDWIHSVEETSAHIVRHARARARR